MTGVQPCALPISGTTFTPATPVLLHPADGAVVNRYRDFVEFTWTPVPGATGYDYQVASDVAFTNVVASYDVLGQPRVVDDRPFLRTAYTRYDADLLDPEHPQTYREVLVFGLRARLPSELEFIDSVVDAVEQGQLPPRLVDQTYFWARTRSGNSSSSMPLKR